MSDHSEIPSYLWRAGIKIRAIAELFRMAGGDIIFEEESFHGLSYLLGGIAEEIEHVREILETP